MDWRDPFNGLNFHDDSVFDQEVCAESYLELDVVVFDWDRMLALNVEPSAPDFVGEDDLVDGFQ